MKKKTIISSALALLALVSVAGASIPVLAATDSTTTTSNVSVFKHKQGGKRVAPTAVEIEKMKVEKTEIHTALISGNFDTWVTAVKKYRGDNAPILKQVTSDNFAKFVEAQSYLEKGQTMMDNLGIKGGGHGMPNFQK